MDERSIASVARRVSVVSLFGAIGTIVWLAHRVRITQQRGGRSMVRLASQVESGGDRMVDHASPRVLVADDNVVNLRAAVRMLEHLGLRADVSANGRDAIDMVDRLGYDLVLMDCQMPTISGQEAATEIRRHEPPDRHTPIVAMAVEVDGDCLDRCLESGMDDMLVKPIRLEDLTALLYRWLPSYREKALEVGGVDESGD